MGILSIFGRKPKDEKNNVVAPEITSAASAANEEASQENSVSENEELIAVIMAAIAASMQKPVSGFRVVSFKERGRW